LQCTHVGIKTDKLAFTFTGKKGISVYKELKDGFLAQAINRHCKSKSERNIFKTNDEKIRAYLEKISGGAGFTVKDFRTYMGTLAALRKIRTMSSPRSVSEFRRFRKEVGRAVGEELGNTPTIALNSYVSPEVFCAWEGDMGAAHGKVSLGKPNEFFECAHYDRE
jgi:DNA topoisomerase-1